MHQGGREMGLMGHPESRFSDASGGTLIGGGFRAALRIRY